VRSLAGGRDKGLDPCLFPSFDGRNSSGVGHLVDRCESDLGGRLGSLRTTSRSWWAVYCYLLDSICTTRVGPSSLREWRGFQQLGDYSP